MARDECPLVSVFVSRTRPAESPAQDLAYLQRTEAFVALLQDKFACEVLDGMGEDEDEPRRSMEAADFFIPMLTKTYMTYVQGHSKGVLNSKGADEMLDFTLASMLKGVLRTIPVVVEPALLERNNWTKKMRLFLGARPIVDLTSNEKVAEAANSLFEIMKKSVENGVLRTLPAGAQAARDVSAKTLSTIRRLANEVLPGTRGWLHVALLERLSTPTKSDSPRAQRIALEAPSGAGKSVFLAEFCLRGQIHNAAAAFRELALNKEQNLRFENSTSLREASQSTDVSFGDSRGYADVDDGGEPSIPADLYGMDDSLANIGNNRGRSIDELSSTSIMANMDQRSSGKRSLRQRFSLRTSRRSDATLASAGSLANESVPIVVGACFLRREDKEGCTIEGLVQTLVAQFCDTIPGFYESLCEVTDTASSSSSSVSQHTLFSTKRAPVSRKRLFKTFIATPLHRLKFKPAGKPIIVIDGIGELQGHDARSMHDLLYSKWDAFIPPWLGTVVSVSSSSNALPAPFETLSIPIECKKNRADIELYIRTYLTQLPRQAITVAQSASQGLFLRARFLLAESSVRGMKQVPFKFQDYLTALLRRFIGKGDDADQRKSMLDAVCVAREPIPVSIAAETMNTLVLSDLDPLFDISTVDDRVRFVHGSIASFLESSDAPEDLRISPQAGHSLLASMFSANYVTDRCAARHVVFHLCRANRRLDAAKIICDVEALRYIFERLEVSPKAFIADCLSCFFDVPTPELCTVSINLSSKDNALVSSSLHSRSSIGSQSENFDEDGAGALNNRVISSVKIREAGEILRALHECMDILEERPRELVPQLLGRLPSDHALRESVAEFVPSIFLCPLMPSFGSESPLQADMRLKKFGAGWNSQLVSNKIDVLNRSGTSTNLNIIQRLNHKPKKRTQKDWKRRFSVGDHPFRLDAVAVCGDLVAAYLRGGSLRVYSLATSETVRIFKGHDARVTSLALDDEYLVSASVDRSIKIWSLALGQCVQTLYGFASEITSVMMDNTHICSSSKEGRLLMWSRETYSNTREVQDPEQSPILALDMNMKWIVTGTESGLVHIYNRLDIEEGAEAAPNSTLEGHTDAVLGLCIYIHVDEIGDADCSSTSSASTSTRGHIREQPFLISCSKDKTVRVWNLETEEVIFHLLGHTGEVTSVDVVDELVYSADTNDEIFVWSLKTGALIYQYNACDGAKTGRIKVLICDGNTMLLPTRAESTDLPLYEVHRPWGQQCSWPSVLKMIDGTLVTASDGFIKLWDAETGKPLYSLQASGVWDVAIDNLSIAAALSDGTVQLYDRQSLKKDIVLTGHRGLVRCIAMDDEIILTGSKDKTARVWLRSTGACVAVLEGHESMVTSVSIVNGELFTVSERNECRIWNRDTSELVCDTDKALERAELHGILTRDDNGAEDVWSVIANGCQLLHLETGAILTLPSPVERIYNMRQEIDTVAIIDENTTLHIISVVRNVSQLI